MVNSNTQDGYEKAFALLKDYAFEHGRLPLMEGTMMRKSVSFMDNLKEEEIKWLVI